MKSAAFEYSRPASIEEACALLAADDDARIIAGGQTLVPMMAMRLARPSRLVDIARIPELAFIRDTGDAIVIGATTRQAAVEHASITRGKLPLLAHALPWVGHTATRNRGTMGGSVANADPAAEIPLVLTTLGGAVTTQTDTARADMDAEAFFLGPMMTATPAGGCVVELRFPTWSRGAIGASFQEISARSGDFAYAAAAAQVALDDDGRCMACAIGIGGATPTPTRLTTANAALINTMLGDADIKAALAPAIEALEIMTDPHASPAYRRRAAMALATKAVATARDEALRQRGKRP